jgi:hypothetical protein
MGDSLNGIRTEVGTDSAIDRHKSIGGNIRIGRYQAEIPMGNSDRSHHILGPEFNTLVFIPSRAGCRYG